MKSYDYTEKLKLMCYNVNFYTDPIELLKLIVKHCISFKVNTQDGLEYVLITPALDQFDTFTLGDRIKVHAYEFDCKGKLIYNDDAYANEIIGFLSSILMTTGKSIPLVIDVGLVSDMTVLSTVDNIFKYLVKLHKLSEKIHVKVD